MDMYPADKIQKVSLLCDIDLMRVIIDAYGEDVTAVVAHEMPQSSECS